MDMPAFATEQYPKGLGHTVPEIELAKFSIRAHPKTCFTMCVPDLLEELKSVQPDTKSIILCGIETHACIHHTTLDLLSRDTKSTSRSIVQVHEQKQIADLHYHACET